MLHWEGRAGRCGTRYGAGLNTVSLGWKISLGVCRRRTGTVLGNELYHSVPQWVGRSWAPHSHSVPPKDGSLEWLVCGVGVGCWCCTFLVALCCGHKTFTFMLLIYCLVILFAISRFPFKLILTPPSLYSCHHLATTEQQHFEWRSSCCCCCCCWWCFMKVQWCQHTVRLLLEWRVNITSINFLTPD